MLLFGVWVFPPIWSELVLLPTIVDDAQWGGGGGVTNGSSNGRKQFSLHTSTNLVILQWFHL